MEKGLKVCSGSLSLPIGASAFLALFFLTGCANGLEHKPLSGLPAVAERQIFNDDWGKVHENAVSDRFTSILRRRFPVGSLEAALIEELRQEGFQYAVPATPGCIPETQSMPVGITYIRCPHWDPNHHLRYSWAPHELPATFWAFCSQTVGVLWDAKDGKLTQIQGYFGGDCV